MARPRAGSIPTHDYFPGTANPGSYWKVLNALALAVLNTWGGVGLDVRILVGVCGPTPNQDACKRRFDHAKDHNVPHHRGPHWGRAAH